jgi:hypothetical protein
MDSFKPNTIKQITNISTSFTFLVCLCHKFALKLELVSFAISFVNYLNYVSSFLVYAGFVVKRTFVFSPPFVEACVYKQQ